MTFGVSMGLGIAALIIVLVMINILVMRIGAKKGLARIREHVPPERIDLHAPMANYFGRTSQGYGQIRGNGALVLADGELWFSRLVPRFDLSIPLGDITGVELVKSHLGKRVFFPLLKVSYRTDGIDDEIAWWVPRPRQWIARLNSELREWNREPEQTMEES